MTLLLDPCSDRQSCGCAQSDAAEMRLVGLNYRTAEAAIRNRAGLTGDRLARFLGTLKEFGAKECAVVSTCNRTEIYAVGLQADDLVRLLANAAGMEEEEIRLCLYIKGGDCAAWHLLRVASGLDSAVLGETEIVFQTKLAWRTAANFGTVGPTLDLLFQRALEASKRVRTETTLCRNVVSLASHAVRQAEATGGYLRGRSVLVVGAGQMAERVAKELRAVGAPRVRILNRTPERAREIASRYGYASGSLSELDAAFREADVAFLTTATTKPLLSRQDLERWMADRKGRSLTIVDLGSPPNVETGPEIAGLRSMDLETLVKECDLSAERRTAAVPHALEILDEELQRLRTALVEREAASTIRGLTDHGEAVRQRTLNWAMEKLPDLTEKERRVVEDLTRRLVLGMLTPPIEELKRGRLDPFERATVERAFRLHTNDER